jgi:glycosyltransferase involved in cell wall biosynthesis
MISMSLQTHCISVVIPTIVAEAELSHIKAALAQQTLPPDEIIVIQDTEYRGAAWARNKGIAQCKGDLIAFLDDDCLPPVNWLESLVSAIDSYQADGAGGTYEETDSLLIDRRKRQNFPDILMEDSQGLVGAGGNLMFTRTWLDKCVDYDGYVFNEAFRISQDWELIIRFRQRGVKLIYVPVRVKHLKTMTLSAYVRQQYGRGKGIAMLYRIQKGMDDKLVSQKSLLWGQGVTGRKRMINFMLALWRKGLGPFDVGSFEKKSDFIAFWLGEKSQGLGFVLQLLTSRHNTDTVNR